VFQEALNEANKKLLSAKQGGFLRSFAIIGGLAVARWGQPRMTQDIDFVVSLADRSLEELAVYLSGKATIGGLQDPLLGAITFMHQAEEVSVPIQLIQFPPAWEEVAFQDVEEEKINKLLLPFVSWKALILLKLYAGGAQDIEDIKAVLKINQPKEKELVELLKQAESLRVDRRLEKALLETSKSIKK